MNCLRNVKISFVSYDVVCSNEELDCIVNDPVYTGVVVATEDHPSASGLFDEEFVLEHTFDSDCCCCGECTMTGFYSRL